MSSIVRLKNPTRLAIIFLGSVLCAWALYVVAVNAFLASQAARRLMNSHPEIAGVSYDSARSFVPFRVTVKNLQLHVEDNNVQVFVSANTAQTRVSLLDCLLQKGFFGTHVHGDGLVLRIRQRLRPKDTAADKVSKLPDIPGFDSPMKAHPNLPVSDAHYDMVTVSLTNIEITNIKEVWVDEYRFDGHLDVSGGFYYKPMRLLRIDPTTIKIKDGALHFGEETVAKNVAASIAVKIPTTNVENFRREAVGGYDLDLDLQTDVTSVAFLNYYLKDVPLVRLEQGAGHLSIKAIAQKGIIDKRSDVRLDTPRVLVRMPYFYATGGAAIRWHVLAGKTRLDVALKDVSIVQESDGKECLRGSQFNVLAQSTGVDVASPLDLDVVLDLPEAHADDLSFLNDYIPPGAGVRIDAGSGIIKGNLEISAKSQHANGVLGIEAKDIKVQNRDATLTGKIAVHGVLKDLDLKTNAADLSGSGIAFDQVTVTNGGQKDKDFWLRLTVADCLLRSAKGEPRWKTHMNVAMKNLSPIMHIIAANLTVPWVVQAFSNWEDVKAYTELTVREKSIGIHHLDAASGALHLQGDFEITEIPGKAKPPRQQPFGSLLVQLGQLSVGVDFEGTKTSAVLFGAEKWFAAHRGEAH